MSTIENALICSGNSETHAHDSSNMSIVNEAGFEGKTKVFIQESRIQFSQLTK